MHVNIQLSWPLGTPIVSILYCFKINYLVWAKICIVGYVSIVFYAAAFADKVIIDLIQEQIYGIKR